MPTPRRAPSRRTETGGTPIFGDVVLGQAAGAVAYLNPASAAPLRGAGSLKDAGDGSPASIEHLGTVEQDEVVVGQLEARVELEGELSRVEVLGDLTALLTFAHEFGEPLLPRPLQRYDDVADRAGAGVYLCEQRRKEAPARKNTALDV